MFVWVKHTDHFSVASPPGEEKVQQKVQLSCQQFWHCNVILSHTKDFSPRCWSLTTQQIKLVHFQHFYVMTPSFNIITTSKSFSSTSLNQSFDVFVFFYGCNNIQSSYALNLPWLFLSCFFFTLLFATVFREPQISFSKSWNCWQRQITPGEGKYWFYFHTLQTSSRSPELFSFCQTPRRGSSFNISQRVKSCHSGWDWYVKSKRQKPGFLQTTHPILGEEI